MDTDPHTRRTPLKMEAGMAVMCLQAEELPRLPANYQKLGERRGQVLPTAVGAAQPPTPDLRPVSMSVRQYVSVI